MGYKFLRVKTSLEGAEARYPAGIDDLNQQWLDQSDINISTALPKLARTIFGCHASWTMIETEGGFDWVGKLVICGNWTQGIPVRILFPSKERDLKTHKMKLTRSIACFAIGMTDKDLQNVVDYVSGKYAEFFDISVVTD